MAAPRDVRARALAGVRAVLPSAADRDLVALGAGLDHQVFGCAGLVVRVAVAEYVDGAGDVAAAPWEPALHVALRDRLGWPVPAVRHAQDGVLVLDRVPGAPLLGREPPAGLATTLGGLLGVLHRAQDVLGDLLPADDAEPADWLEELDGPADLLAVVRRDVPPPPPVRVPVHNDLGAEHVLVDGGVLTGVIDWSDAAVADPAVDVARLLRDCGEGFVADLLAGYDGPVDDGFAARARFYARCATLEDLAFGEETGRTEYLDNALRAVPRLFGMTA